MYYEFKDDIKGIVYWCDTMGNLHHNDDYDLRSPKELPKELQVAFENLWAEGMYLVEFNGHYSVAIEASYDEDFANRLSISYEDVKEFAREQALKYARIYPKLDIIFGDDTTQWNNGSMETVVLILCPWNMPVKDFHEISEFVEYTKYLDIDFDSNPEKKSEKTEVSEAAETGCKKIYSFDNFEGDKGIIIATSREEAIEIYEKKYPARQIVEEDESVYYNYGCYISECCDLDGAELVVAAEW